jgi:hypothetical protein
MLETWALDAKSAAGGNFLRSDMTELIESEGWALVFSVAIDTQFDFLKKKHPPPKVGGE